MEFRSRRVHLAPRWTLAQFSDIMALPLGLFTGRTRRRRIRAVGKSTQAIEGMLTTCADKYFSGVMIRRVLTIVSRACLIISLGVASLQHSQADQDTMEIIRRFVSGETRKTWQGAFRFKEAIRLQGEGFATIFAVTYASREHTGQIVDFVRVSDSGQLMILYRGRGNSKGVTPELDTIDILPQGSKTEIIVRWRHPGTGGHRTIQKFRWDGDTLALVSQSDYLGKELGDQWICSQW